MTAAKPKNASAEDAGVVPGTDAPAVDPVKGPEGAQPASEPLVTPAEWPDEPELKSQKDYENVEINKAVTEYGLHAGDSSYGRGGAQSHGK